MDNNNEGLSSHRPEYAIERKYDDNQENDKIVHILERDAKREEKENIENEAN